MKKNITAILFISFFNLTLSAQKKEENTDDQFNRWSLEFNVGDNKAIKPFATGYSSSNESKLNIANVNHYNIGVRYMVSSKFGLKFDIGSDKISNQNGSNSLPFKTHQYSIGFQGVINAGKIMGFEEFSKTIGILAHAGIQISQLTSQMGINRDVSEYDGGIMVGLTPQIRITNKLVFTADFTSVSNMRQHLNWDGSNSEQSNNLSGLMYTTSLGITYYFGNNEKHADWYNASVMPKQDSEVIKRLDAMEELMNDTDRDGVLDYLDAENNTPNGVAVDAKGRFVDANSNGTPDEMEPRRDAISEMQPSAVIANSSVNKDDLIKTLINQGFINVFFDVNKDTPNEGSSNNIFCIIKFLHDFPDQKVKFTGYADIRGEEQKNIDLSKRRVQNIYDIIVQSGIQPNRLSIQGMGVDTSNSYNSKTSFDLARRVSIAIQK